MAKSVALTEIAIMSLGLSSFLIYMPKNSAVVSMKFSLYEYHF